MEGPLVECTGQARVDKRTKELIPRLGPGEIAVICHEALDEVSAQGLIDARVRAVVNAADSVSSRYPNRGPSMLVDAGILLVDRFDSILLERIDDGDILTLRGGELYRGGEWLGSGVVRTRENLEASLHEARGNLQHEIDRFIENTLEHAYREKGLLGEIEVPPLRSDLSGRVVVVVVRGQGYKDDLLALKPYIHDTKPFLVGVDGGADALVEAGYKPDLIIGDMDSVTDRTLRMGSELLVHAYRDGRAPGLGRLRRLGLDARVIRAPGTSEDVALWVAYKQGAKLIVAVGTHSNVIDFLEKGRKGMASTFLVRLVVGPILFDAKGVSELYRRETPSNPLGKLALAAGVPFLLVWTLSDVVQQWASLLWLRLRVLTGW